MDRLAGPVGIVPAGAAPSDGPAGVASGWHQHPGEEVGYILAGTVRMEIEGQPTLTLHAGSPFLMPPRTPHTSSIASAAARPSAVVTRWGSVGTAFDRPSIELVECEGGARE